MPEWLWMSPGHSGSTLKVEFSPDGRFIYAAGTYDHTLKQVRVSDGKLLQTINAFYGNIHSFALSRDGAYISSVEDPAYGSGENSLKTWQTANTSQRTGFNAIATLDKAMWSVDFSPDQRLLATGNQQYDVQLFDAASGALLRTMSGHEWFPFDVKFSPDGKILASASGDKTIRLWDVATGNLLRVLTGHTFFVLSISFSPDGKTLASASWDGTVRFWDVASGQLLRTISIPARPSLAAVTYAPDGNAVATVGDDSAVHIIRASDGVILRSITNVNDGGSISLAYNRKGTMLAASGYDSRVTLWNPNTGQSLGELLGRRAAVPDVAVSPDGFYVADSGGNSSGGPTIEIVKAQDGTLLRQCVGHQDVINSIAFSPDSARMASGAGSPPPDTVDPTVRVWNVSDARQLAVMPGHSGGTTSVSISPDGQLLASGGRDSKVKLWSMQNYALVRTLSGHANWVTSVAFSPDGSILASADSHSKIVFWRTSDWTILRQVTLSANIAQIRFSPNGSLLGVTLETYDDNAVLLRVSDGSIMRSWKADEAFMDNIAFSTDGQYVVTTSGYTYLMKFWRVQDGALLAAYNREAGWGQFPTLPIVFHPDGLRFFYGRTDATIVMALAPWAFRTVAPTSFTIDRGKLIQGNLSSVTSSDDSYLVIQNGVVPTPSQPPISLTFEGTAPQGPISQLQFKAETRSQFFGLAQTIELFDFEANQFVTVDERAGTLHDGLARVPMLDLPQRFVQAVTGRMVARVSVKPDPATFGSVWRHSFDFVGWIVSP